MSNREKKMNLSSIRVEYDLHELNEDMLEKDPMVQAQKWMKEAIEAGIQEPTAFTLSTVNALGRPSSRVMLVKDITDEGFCFFTNYESNKGIDIAGNPYVSINFFWIELQRQLRVQGVAEKISEAESDEYFNSRPLGSRIGAIVSKQSREIPDRKSLDAAYESMMKDTAHHEHIKRPSYWGGYLVKPYYMEFWQGRPNRLHDRLVYEKQPQGWVIKRLSP
ncbi:MAG: pyridoxamine 5'-phosphate oxidase [Cytophagaceae bacterium]|nr:pyridoxamine 5'-phosphate oxidase [Cytophagaceae bacterium]MDW8455767.1 pyridoxamine 5'-phosphate oxidase [Cytophagaceae bacterium]